MIRHLNPKNFPKGSRRANAHAALTKHISTAHGILAVALVAVMGGRMLYVLAQTIPEQPSPVKKIDTPAHNSKGIIGRAPDRIIVKFKDSISDERRNSILTQHDSKELRNIPQIKTRLVTVPQGMTPETFLADFKEKQHDNLEFAELDSIVTPTYIPNDPSLTSEWHIEKIQSPSAWNTAQGSGTVVAVLDTGTNCNHPDLSSNCVSGWNVASDTSDYSDIHNHGTWTAGTVAAVGDNATGVAGVAYKAKIMPIRITNDPAGYAYYSDIAKGITYAADHGARVVTNSYRSTEGSSVQSAATYLRSKGGIFVAAAGNDGLQLSSSTNISNIVTVGATDSNDTKTSWSNYGPVIDVTAPGYSILTTSRSGGYDYVWGTSFSTPITAGVLALIFSANPNLTADQAQNILYSTAKDLDSAGWDQYYGWGRVDALAAVNAAITTTGNVDTLAPSAPQNLATTNLTSSQITLSWTASTDNVGVTSYEIFRNEAKIATTASGTSYIDKTVSPASSYTYKIRALDASGNTSAMSSNISVTTPNATLLITSNNVTSKTATGATISVGTNIPAQTTIVYGNTPSNLTQTQSGSTLTTNSTITLSGLAKKTTYYYQATVTDQIGSVQKSAVTSFTTKPR